jgi:hypothetical protein
MPSIMWISHLQRWADSARDRSPIRRGGTKFLQSGTDATTPSPFQNCRALSTDRHSYKAPKHRRKATESFRPAPKSFRCIHKCSFLHTNEIPVSNCKSAKSNIELSCAAESPTRSEPQQRHPCEKEGHLRRQLQRFVRCSKFIQATLGSAHILDCWF